MASKIRYKEKEFRAEAKLGNQLLYDPSPVGVIRAEDPFVLGEMDDNDILDIYRSWLYQNIPKDQFRIWGREPFGQEKIDAAQKGTGDAAP